MTAPNSLRGILVRYPNDAQEIDDAVATLYRSLPHHDACVIYSDGPGDPYRCTCWKEVIRLTMLEAYDFGSATS